MHPSIRHFLIRGLTNGIFTTMHRGIHRILTIIAFLFLLLFIRVINFPAGENRDRWGWTWMSLTITMHRSIHHLPIHGPKNGLVTTVRGGIQDIFPTIAFLFLVLFIHVLDLLLITMHASIRHFPIFALKNGLATTMQLLFFPILATSIDGSLCVLMRKQQRKRWE